MPVPVPSVGQDVVAARAARGVHGAGHGAGPAAVGVGSASSPGEAGNPVWIAVARETAVTEAISKRDTVLRFLNDWRDRLLTIPAEQMTRVQLSEIVALNTIIDAIEKEAAE